MSDDRYVDDVYTVRKKFLSFIGQSFHVYNAHGELIFFCRQKGFKLKEDIRLYSDESKSQEVLTLSARQVLDWGATYDVVDPVANESVGALRRKAMKSMIRDEWLLLESNGHEIGRVYEDSQLLASAAPTAPVDCRPDAADGCTSDAHGQVSVHNEAELQPLHSHAYRR